MTDTPEADRLDDTPHPRETMRLFGHAGAEQELLDGARSGRLHHAWLLGGPEGVGKATLAYRFAKFLLATPDPSRATSLDSDHALSAVRQVVSQSHVDLAVLRRTWRPDAKALSTVIRVEDVRRAVAFFGSTAGAGGWRIAIVDTADDLDAPGANALLKVLEEPPARALFLILAHQPGRLLPTIRSRCRRLALGPLAPGDVLAAARAARPDLDARPLQAAATIADGSVRRALVLAGGGGVDVHGELVALLDRLPALDMSAAHALAERCANRTGTAAFDTVLASAQEWLHRRVHEPGVSPARLAGWAEVWDKLQAGAAEVEAYNLDRRPFVLATLRAMADTARL